MGFFSFVGVLYILYNLFCIILLCFIDTDISYFFWELFGNKISHLKGKVVWITGASTGIGKGLALQLAKNGVKLVLSARRVDLLQQVKAQCLEASGGQLSHNDILILEMDVLRIDKHQSYFASVIQHFGVLNVLINNAGRSQRAEWTDITLDVDRQLFDLDVFAVVNLTRIAVRYFEDKQIRGHLAVTSSMAGLLPAALSASYVGAKHAIHGYYGSLKTEKPNLDVTILCPGPIATDFLQECFTDIPGAKYGKAVEATDRRMTIERCGHVFATSIANRLSLTWCGLFPLSLLVYIALYYPNLAALLRRFVTQDQLKSLREGRETTT